MPGCSTCWRSRIHSLPVSSPDATKKSVYTMPAQYKVFSKQGELQKLNSHSTTELKLNSTNFHKFQLICRQNKQHRLHDLFLDCYHFCSFESSNWGYFGCDGYAMRKALEKAPWPDSRASDMMAEYQSNFFLVLRLLMVNWTWRKGKKFRLASCSWSP